jgi:phosphate transport system substrate-binding protein
MSARRARAALLLLIVLVPVPAAATVLRIHGSNTIGERLAPELVTAWMRARGAQRIEREPLAPEESVLRGTIAGERIAVHLAAHGTSTGFADLARGAADVAMASRPAGAADIARAAARGRLDSPAQEIVVALDGIAVIVHPSNPLRAARLSQVRAVFSGQVRDWAALGGEPGRIALHARDEKSGTWDTFRSLVLGEAALADGARRYESTQALAAAVAADPRAIGFVGVSGVGSARALAIEDAGHALAPAPFSVAVEDYALARRLYFYAPADPPALARDFVEFSLSPTGQHVVEAAGFVAQRIQPFEVVVRDDAPTEYLALVSGARRLSVNFRFGAGSRFLDGKVMRDVDRLAQFMREPANRGARLMLVGFADASEASPYLATTLSNDRVDLVARLLEERGVGTHRARGMGGAAPIADNTTAQGRQRNRRVEAWLASDGDADRAPRDAAAGPAHRSGRTGADAQGPGAPPPAAR